MTDISGKIYTGSASIYVLTLTPYSEFLRVTSANIYNINIDTDAQLQRPQRLCDYFSRCFLEFHNY